MSTKSSRLEGGLEIRIPDTSRLRGGPSSVAFHSLLAPPSPSTSRARWCEEGLINQYWPYRFLLVARFVVAQSAVAAPTPAHDANLTIQPSSTRLSATILRVIRAPPAASLPRPTPSILRPRALATYLPFPPGRFSCVRCSHRRTGEGETISCALSAAVWISFVGEPPDPAFLHELPPTDSVSAERSMRNADGGRVAAFPWKHSAAGNPRTLHVRRPIMRGYGGFPSDIVERLCTICGISALGWAMWAESFPWKYSATVICRTLGVRNGGRRCRFSVRLSLAEFTMRALIVWFK
ncbi:hypothetical protein C8J57DRAFT_1506968 [Mycena rebaudengoi]|nr:hypothetical protein C8J57DRAFT_1506968 [Mycena rebaudengoi]